MGRRMSNPPTGSTGQICTDCHRLCADAYSSWESTFEKLQASVYKRMGSSSPPRHGQPRFECSCGFTEETLYKQLVHHLASSCNRCHTVVRAKRKAGARPW